MDWQRNQGLQRKLSGSSQKSKERKTYPGEYGVLKNKIKKYFKKDGVGIGYY